MLREPPVTDQLRQLHELELQLDLWEAAATVPVTRAARRSTFTRSPVRPAVDPQVWLLHVRHFHRRIPEVRSRLVTEYEGHARQLAHRFYRHREPLDDLTQVAMEGLLQALDRFDPRRRVPFLGFAKPTIVGALKRYYRDAGWSLRVPRRVHDLAVSIGPAIDVLSQDLGRAPTHAEIADLLDLPVRDVEEALTAADARNVASVESTLVPGDGAAMLASEDASLRGMENRVALGQALRVLSDEDRDVIYRYFVLELSQDEIASELGVSQMQVSRVVSRILRRLRSHLPA